MEAQAPLPDAAARHPVEVARAIGEDVLFPAAPTTDASDAVPAGHLDLLADAGLYGLVGPPEAGGLGADFPSVLSVVEVLAGSCLTTTFVWVQHHGLVRALAAAPPGPLRDEWLGPLCRGSRRAGLALAGLLPGPPRLRADPVDGGWALDGTAPWVTGWGLVDVLHVAARGPDDTVVWLVVDAAGGPHLSAERLRLVACDASVTVRLHFDRLVVPADRVLGVERHDPSSVGPPAQLRVNGSLALGVAGRCCALLGASPLDAAVDECRRALDTCGPEGLPAARAAASELALRAAATLVVHQGGGSITAGEHAQRLAREALFLLVFGTRAPIRAALLDRLAGGFGG